MMRFQQTAIVRLLLRRFQWSFERWMKRLLGEKNSLRWIYGKSIHYLQAAEDAARCCMTPGTHLLTAAETAAAQAVTNI